jgi:hypothetical protein
MHGFIRDFLLLIPRMGSRRLFEPVSKLDGLDSITNP